VKGAAPLRPIKIRGGVPSKANDPFRKGNRRTNAVLHRVHRGREQRE
jgi:hypothetical protein